MSEERKASIGKFLKDWSPLVATILSLVLAAAFFTYKMDYHVKNNDIHVTSKEHHEMNRHMADPLLHLTVDDRYNLKKLLEEVEEIKADIKEIRKKVE